tara:strand:- start:1144 stop:1710 length:567 start_codon:yes stop_codon:yes gene_type:complete
LEPSAYEIIVVDDASEDDSWEIIRSYGNLIKPIRHVKNTGVAMASNTGIREAAGEYIVRVDGDDFINRNFLHTMSEVLEWNKDIGFVYCDHIVVKEDMTRQISINTLDKLLNHGAGVMFRKEYIEAIGLYKEDLKNCEDYDLILRYIKNFDGYRLRLPYYRYFKRPLSLSTQVTERERIKKEIRDGNI